MKKALTVTFALCLAALCGCGSSGSASEAPGSSAADASSVQTPEASSSAEVKYEPCTKRGSVYESKMTNLRFTLPEGYDFVSDETLLGLTKQNYTSVEEMVSLDKHIMDAAALKEESIPKITFQFSNNNTNGLNESYTTKEIAEMSQKSQAEKRPTGEMKAFTLDDGNEYMYFTASEKIDEERTLYNTNVLRMLGKYTFLMQYTSFDDDFETAILPCFESLS